MLEFFMVGTPVAGIQKDLSRLGESIASHQIGQVVQNEAVAVQQNDTFPFLNGTVHVVDMVCKEMTQLQHSVALFRSNRRCQWMPEVQGIVQDDFVSEIFPEQKLSHTAVFHESYTVTDSKGLLMVIADIEKGEAFFCIMAKQF